jgi:hypothetical protein
MLSLSRGGRKSIGPAALLLALGTLSMSPAATKAEPLAVTVTGKSEPVLCAEKDNVTLELASPAVSRFRIEAVHPAYIGALARDSFEPDWTACDMSGDPVHTSDVSKPTRRTIYEEPDFWLVAWTFPTYWRPSTALVRVGDRLERGVHLLQLWAIRPMGGEEVVVMYPQDGYWRARPLAPEGRAPTAFGSSFLVGPVEMAGRPIVAIDEIAFDPGQRTFRLRFTRGGSGAVEVARFDRERTVLQVTFDAPIGGHPFAALRSMYVTEFNNDVAHVGLRAPGAPGWLEQPIMRFTEGRATHLWAGRHTISRHNSSSPDMVFDSFR